MIHSNFAFKLLAGVTLVLGIATGLSAQTIYRIVGADGKITFSDKPPADIGKATATNASGKTIGGSGEANALPYELRQIAARYPVTLYSGAGCVPCNSGRLMLQGRGIPFVENTISTNEDNEALQRLSGDNALPFLTIGGQKIKGFSEAEWGQFLSAANYPQASVLPNSYRYPPPRPLVVVQKPAAPKAEDENQARNDDKGADSRLPPVAPAAPPNPLGIRF